MREILSSEDSSGRRAPRKEHVVLWQLANGLLETAIYFWLGGFMVFVWTTTRMTETGQSQSDQVVSYMVLEKLY